MAAKVLTAAQFKGFIDAIGELVRSVDILVHDLHEFLHGDISDVGFVNLDAAVNRASKAKPPAAPTPPPAAAIQPPSAPKPVSGIRYEELAAAVLKVAEVKGQSAAVAILKSFGATHAKQLPEGEYAEALKEFEAALAPPASLA